MSDVKRYEAVHIRYEDSNIRYGEGCEVEVVAAYDYDALYADRKRLLDALEKISSIENRYNCGDWDEIEEARNIALEALELSQ